MKGEPFGLQGEGPGAYVLHCDKGEWVPLMTAQEYVDIVQKKPVQIAPVPTRPTTTTTITTIPAPSAPTVTDANTGGTGGSTVTVTGTGFDVRAFLDSEDRWVPNALITFTTYDSADAILEVVTIEPTTVSATILTFVVPSGIGADYAVWNVFTEAGSSSNQSFGYI